MDSNDIIVYTVLEVSKILRVNKKKVYDLIDAGLLDCLKLGGKKIPKMALESFLNTYLGYDLEDAYNIKKLELANA